jgi:hypothetical protein
MSWNVVAGPTLLEVAVLKRPTPTFPKQSIVGAEVLPLPLISGWAPDPSIENRWLSLTESEVIRPPVIWGKKQSS